MASPTDRLAIHFVVQHYPDGRPWLELESLDSSFLPSLGGSILGLDLIEGTTVEQAEEVVAYLNQRVVGVLRTRVFRETLQAKPFRAHLGLITIGDVVRPCADS